MGKHQTPEQRAAWAAYMREYRQRQREGGTPADPRGSRPTPRQVEILLAYADPERGGTQARVAESLGISVSSVNNQMVRLMRRLGVRTPTQALMRVMKEGADGTTPQER